MSGTEKNKNYRGWWRLVGQWGKHKVSPRDLSRPQRADDSQPSNAPEVVHGQNTAPHSIFWTPVSLSKLPQRKNVNFLSEYLLRLPLPEVRKVEGRPNEIKSQHPQMSPGGITAFHSDSWKGKRTLQQSVGSRIYCRLARSFVIRVTPVPLYNTLEASQAQAKRRQRAKFLYLNKYERPWTIIRDEHLQVMVVGAGLVGSMLATPCPERLPGGGVWQNVLIPALWQCRRKSINLAPQRPWFKNLQLVGCKKSIVRRSSYERKNGPWTRWSSLSISIHTGAASER